MSAKLCIVMPVLDEAERLRELLQALQPLRQRGALVIVADGGSQDGSLDIAHDLADLVLQVPRGRAAQMNAGAAACEGELLLFLHADTHLPDDADALIEAALAPDSGHHWGRFDVRFDSPRRVLRLVAGAMNLRSRWTGIATGDQAMFVRRSLFNQVGGFPDLPLMEDITLSSTLKRHGPPACLRPPVITSARRWERRGVWRTIVLMWRLRAAYFLGADPTQLAIDYGYRPREH